MHHDCVCVEDVGGRKVGGDREGQRSGRRARRSAEGGSSRPIFVFADRGAFDRPREPSERPRRGVRCGRARCGTYRPLAPRRGRPWSITRRPGFGARSKTFARARQIPTSPTTAGKMGSVGKRARPGAPLTRAGFACLHDRHALDREFASTLDPRSGPRQSDPPSAFDRCKWSVIVAQFFLKKKPTHAGDRPITTHQPQKVKK